MARIGEILVDHGWITPAQLRTALRNQQVLGGRLGTCLLEMEALDEQLLLQTLSEQLGLPPVGADELRDVDPATTDLLPAALARRYAAVPFRVLGGHVDLVMLDVDNLAHQDELAFGLGKPLRLHVAPEVRIREALARHFGASLSDRLEQLQRRLDRTALPADSLAVPHLGLPAVGSGAGLPDLRVAAAERVASGSPDPLPDESVPEEAAAASGSRPSEPAGPASAPSATSAPPPAAPGAARGRNGHDLLADASGSEEVVERTEQLLADASGGEEIGLTLGIALGRLFDRGIVFKIHSGEVSGWTGSGDGIDLERLRHYRVDLGEESVFRDLERGAGLHRGPLPPVPAHRRLARCWGGGLDHPCVVVPVRLGGRLVAALYGDRREDAGEADATPLLHVLAARTASAFQRRIVARREGRARGASAASRAH